jgi:hypothetical protein
MEPAAGDGNIIAAIETWDLYRSGQPPTTQRSLSSGERSWAMDELGQEHLLPLAQLQASLGIYDEDIYSGDFLEHTPSTTYDVIATNPPYSLAEEFVKHSLRFAEVVAMLLPQGFLASDGRQPWISKNVPDQYVLPNRPSFGLNKDGRKGTDSNDYAWMIWRRGKAHVWGKTFVLERTSVEERYRREDWINEWRANLNPDPRRVAMITQLAEEQRLRRPPPVEPSEPEPSDQHPSWRSPSSRGHEENDA